MCVCVSVCFADLVNSQFHSPCSPRLRGGSGGSKIYTSTKSLLSIYPEVKLNSSGMSVFVEILIIRGEKEDSRSFCPPHCFSLYPTFSPDLHMNGTLCSDIVSRLPNEGALIMSRVIFCAAGGCKRGEEGREGRKIETTTAERQLK